MPTYYCIPGDIFLPYCMALYGVGYGNALLFIKFLRQLQLWIYCTLQNGDLGNLNAHPTGAEETLRLFSKLRVFDFPFY